MNGAKKIVILFTYLWKVNKIQHTLKWNKIVLQSVSGKYVFFFEIKYKYFLLANGCLFFAKWNEYVIEYNFY